MLDMTPEEIRLTRDILARHLPSREVRVFGSRARGCARRYSDLDLALMGDAPLPDPIRAEILADFDDSDLPFRVDLLEWRNAPPSLRATIDREGLILTPTKEKEGDIHV